MSSNPDTRARCINHTGWHDGVLVFPHQTIGEQNGYVFFQSEAQSKDYQQCGSLKDWREQVAALCCGNSRLVLAVSCAFAAMLFIDWINARNSYHTAGAPEEVTIAMKN